MVKGSLHAAQARLTLQDRVDGGGRIAEQEDCGEPSCSPQGRDSLEELLRRTPPERHTHGRSQAGPQAKDITEEDRRDHRPHSPQPALTRHALEHPYPREGGRGEQRDRGPNLGEPQDTAPQRALLQAEHGP